MKKDKKIKLLFSFETLVIGTAAVLILLTVLAVNL